MLFSSFWNKFSDISRGKTAQEAVSTWEIKLEQLLDITSSKCKITLCNKECSKSISCLDPAHIQCTWPRGKNIP